MMNRSPHYTKKGPGRRHVEGRPGRKKRRGRGFKGATFSVPRPLSIFHPTERKRSARAVQSAQVVSLKRIYASLRDDMSTPGEWFEMGDAPPPAETTASLDKVRAATAAKRGAKPAAAAHTAATKTLDQYRAEIDGAESAEAAQSVLDEAGGLSPEDQEHLKKAFAMAWEAL